MRNPRSHSQAIDSSKGAAENKRRAGRTRTHGWRLGQGVEPGLDLGQAGQLKRGQRVSAGARGCAGASHGLLLRLVAGAVIGLHGSRVCVLVAI